MTVRIEAYRHCDCGEPGCLEPGEPKRVKARNDDAGAAIVECLNAGLYVMAYKVEDGT